jgi:hypothetical protein
VKRVHPAVIGVPAAFITLFGAWLTIHSAGNYTTCTGLGILGPGDCSFYRNATIVGVVIGAVGVGLVVWSLVLVQQAASRKRSEPALAGATPNAAQPREVAPVVGPGAAPPGWYPHPQKAGDLAYWDGQAWTWEKPSDGEAKPI